MAAVAGGGLGGRGLGGGVQKFGYALFIMDASALAKLNATQGWEIGAAPTLVVVDAGIAKSLSTSTVIQLGLTARS